MALLTLPFIASCALHRSDRSGVATPLVVEAATRCVTPTDYREKAVLTPAFVLVGSDVRAKDASLVPLDQTASTFQWQFGDCPSQLGVIVVDTTDVAATDSISLPPATLTTVLLEGGGLGGPEGVSSAQTLARQTRLVAGESWLDDFAQRWRQTLDANHVALPYVSADALASDGLPDWLHVAALRTLADAPSLEDDRVPATDALPLRKLLTLRLTPEQLTVAKHELRGAAPRGDDGVLVVDSADIRFVRSFIAQSTSLLRYLRETEGDDATSKLFGAAVAGIDPDWMLSRLPRPTTPERLEKAWRNWSKAESRVAAVRSAR